VTPTTILGFEVW